MTAATRSAAAILTKPHMAWRSTITVIYRGSESTDLKIYTPPTFLR
jgi:hypothetical protein